MKKALIGFAAFSTALALVPMFAAFEAHVVNVTAKIENALSVPLEELDFGTVFPQEQLDKTFNVALSDSFIAEDRVDDVDYIIRQKPKCGLPIPDSDPTEYSEFGQVTENGQGNFICKDEGFEVLPLLCPYLSKHEITDDGIVTENDSNGISAFHGLPGPWTLQTTLTTQVRGHLAKAQEDFSDTWNIDFKVPCFGNHCAQDWNEFVLGINDGVDPDDYVQPIELEHQLYGCDLWLEVTNISLPGFGCYEQADVMLVLDRSGSIDDAEEALMKSAATAFVTALNLSTDGPHAGMSSFGTTGSLDQILTDTAALVNAAIAALTTPDGELTNLAAGITLATAELTGANDRPDGTSPDFMVVITDGNPNQPDNEATAEAAAIAAADAARAVGIEVYVVGIGGDVDAAFLEDEIADDSAHYFAAADFGDLETILEDLVSCEEDELVI